eukprot:UN08540
MLNAEPDVYSDHNALSMWLNSIGLMEYFDLFIEQGFGEQMLTLSTLTDADLIKLGITKLAHRKRILIQIQNNQNVIYNVNNVNQPQFEQNEDEENDEMYENDENDENMNIGPGIQQNMVTPTGEDQNDGTPMEEEEEYEYEEYDEDEDDQIDIDNQIYEKPLNTKH